MKILISLLVLFLSTVGFTQNAESVLKSLQNKFDSITDLTADVAQKNNGQSNLTGKMYFKKENNIRLELGNQTIVADGKTSWNYNKKNKKVIISDYDEAGSGLLSINYLVYQYPSECDLSLSAEGTKQILNLKPKSKKIILVK
ncbi:MAG: outer membrane lipoprotein carrier protein LolA [Ignavibacteriales bacterium]|nr:outer membrane lipoprotein carrier protein LolA [Ignavibacteriales bacterium]